MTVVYLIFEFVEMVFGYVFKNSFRTILLLLFSAILTQASVAYKTLNNSRSFFYMHMF